MGIPIPKSGSRILRRRPGAHGYNGDLSLRHALLGVLKDEPLTGYDLVRHFQGTVGFVWSAPQSQIYPELRRMEAAGLIEAKVAPRGQRAQKRIYSVTQQGMDELRRWATDFIPLPAQRDPIILKAAFFDLAPLESVREQLRAHVAQYQWRMEQWQARVDAIGERRAELVEVWLARQPPEQHEGIIRLKIHALEGLMARARSEINWAREGLALCDQIEARQRQSTESPTRASAGRAKGAQGTANASLQKLRASGSVPKLQGTGSVPKLQSGRGA